jgi:tryptophan synthase alpha chain
MSPVHGGRIAATFAALRDTKRAALIPFVEAFDPCRASTLELLNGMAENGADIIEIGVPFTDPMADGPTIQAAGRRALAAGATLRGVLGIVREFRLGNGHTPLVLMGYLNPILSYGVDAFARDAAEAGVDPVG